MSARLIGRRAHPATPPRPTDWLPNDTYLRVYLEPAKGDGAWVEGGYFETPALVTDDGKRVVDLSRQSERHAQRTWVKLEPGGADLPGADLVEFAQELQKAAEFVQASLGNARRLRLAVEVAGEPPTGVAVWFDEDNGRWATGEGAPFGALHMFEGGKADGGTD